MSTAAMDKLLLLSLQFLQKTGEDMSLPDPTRPVLSGFCAFAWAVFPAWKALPPHSWN